MELTREQQLVVDTRNKNILVSAAAGSGKTRVLVQRIIAEILDEKNPIDVDRILVVTFTNAAAAEMKERIRKEIDKEVNKNPSRADLRRQSTLIHNAQIRTIDSFCSWVVKNYFYEIDQDPSFRIGSEGELKMLSDQLLDELISKRLQTNEEGFRLLADAYISGRNISRLKEMVLMLYYKAMSNPWPMQWFDEATALYRVSSVDELENSEIMTGILDSGRERCRYFARMTDLALNLYDPAMDTKDRAVLAAENNLYKNAAEAQSYDEFYGIVSSAVFDKYMASKKALGENLEDAKLYRNQSKEGFKEMVESYFFLSISELFDDITFVGVQVNALVDLAREFSVELGKIKKKKNLYDFNDIEHMALEILRNKDSKEHEKRTVALELSNLFAEVMVDEYQDSNRLQEAILTAVCKDNNYFTVGDVKQSIYAFRQADPAIFMEKFDDYIVNLEKNIRIDLDKNFRSRAEVLNFCNNVFAPLMQSDMGNVAYDEQAALKVGALGFIGDAKDYEPEILIADKNSFQMTTAGIKNTDEFEAHIVAGKIQEMLRNNFQVSIPDKEHEGKLLLRPLQLNDIVILMRATKGHGDTFIKVLREYNIPAFVEAETGFFDRDEVSNILSMLQVVDNPNNDIALAAVLHSPLFNFTTEQLALIRTVCPEGSFYQCIFEYYNNNPEDKAVAGFMELLTEFRFQAIDTPIHDMISSIIERTGYISYVSALPMGNIAVANINKLIDEAVKYEASSAKSINRFVSYIDNLKTYEEELGLAKTVSENDVAVRIMTIHKSKGLEFPVVFLARSSGRFRNDTGDVFYHPAYGIAMQYKNPLTRVQGETVFANLLKEKLKAENLGEEQRILYVALTRAKEKLIVVGSLEPKKDQTIDEKLDDFDATPGVALDYYTKLNSSSYLDWILRALRAANKAYSIKTISCEELVVNEAKRQVSKAILRKELEAIVKDIHVEAGDTIREKTDFSYTSGIQSDYKQKYSVSDLKHQAMAEKFEANEDAIPDFIYHEKESYVPTFMREDYDGSSLNDLQIPLGALYGTAMHRFLECFDFSEDSIVDSFNSQYEFMKSTSALTMEQQERINTTKLKLFLQSDLADRMHKAAKKGLLYKEQPFVLGSNPKELFDDEAQEGVLTLVQGIIDVFFVEEDGIVLMDYKTDKVDGAEALMVRYKRQLELYKQAIEAGFGVNVKEVLIYSFCLDETIPV